MSSTNATDRQPLIAFHEGIRARRSGEAGRPPVPWDCFPESLAWVRGWSAADAEILAAGGIVDSCGCVFADLGVAKPDA
jgi:hypothetical protein